MDLGKSNYIDKPVLCTFPKLQLETEYDIDKEGRKRWIYLCNVKVLYWRDRNMLSVESQKGVNAVQRCSVENQKGAIAVQSQWR